MKTTLLSRWGAVSALSLVLLSANSAHAQSFFPKDTKGIPDVGGVASKVPGIGGGSIGNAPNLGTGGGSDLLGIGSIPSLGGGTGGTTGGFNGGSGLGNIGNILNGGGGLGDLIGGGGGGLGDLIGGGGGGLGDLIGGGGGGLGDLIGGGGGGLGDLIGGGGGGIGNILRDPLGFVVGQLQQWLSNSDIAWGEISTDKLLSSLPSGGQGSPLDDIVKTIDGTKGALGMPDPGRSAQAASEQIDSNSKVDIGEVAPAHQRTVLRNSIDRELTRASSQATLGKEGQQRTQQAAQSAGQAVQAINQAAQTAQGLSVTQDVMKQITVQNAQMSNLLGAMYTEELGAKMDRAYTNLNLTNISQSLDQQQRARRSELTGEAAALMQIANQSSLR